PGADSAFYLVERRLAQLAFPRAPGESLARWLSRVGSASPAVRTAPLPALLTLHYRYRFDPAGLDAAELAELDAGARAWVAGHHMGGPEMAPQTPQRSGRAGGPHAPPSTSPRPGALDVPPPPPESARVPGPRAPRGRAARTSA